MNDENVTFDQYRDEWLADVREGQPSTIELGRRFARKLFTAWQPSVDGTSLDLYFCDGSGDGGIDIAYLDQGDQEDDGSASGHTWYLIQSKYGSAFQGTSTIIAESLKIIDTLDGTRAKLSSLSSDVREAVTNFRNKANPDRDRITVVFATEQSLTATQMQALYDIRQIGQKRLGQIFDVESVSIETIFHRVQDEIDSDKQTRISIRSQLQESSTSLFVGCTTLFDLYHFLYEYWRETQDIERLYEKNVRYFLGNKGGVNREIEKTLREDPESFGLYNNGVTIVATRVIDQMSGVKELVNPYIVNGCQTTRTIWDVCRRKLRAGGTGEDAGLDNWIQRIKTAVVVTKLVQLGSNDKNELLRNITRYTNTQNAVRQKDFTALDPLFRKWAKEKADKYDVFLEIQRGQWESRKALQDQNRPNIHKFKEHASATDLLKVYGAGWLKEAGAAWSNNADFLPRGAVFAEITKDESFDADDLYAAYRLQGEADFLGFGRGSQPSRRITRYLFYLVFIEMVEFVLRTAGRPSSRKDITQALINLYSQQTNEARQILITTAVNVIDQYMDDNLENAMSKEPKYQEHGNRNSYLKWEQVGKTTDSSPLFRHLLDITQSALRMFGPLKSITDALTAHTAG